jgi:phosphoenolpyruvate phosphomutase
MSLRPEGSVRLRRALAGDGPVRLAGAHNAFGAKLAERAGFEGVWASGFEISTAYCVPDAGILGMSETLAAAESMALQVDIPVVADCDTGFGNVDNVTHMVRRFEAAGVAAVCIEDKVFPKLNSYVPGLHELEPMETFVRKIGAAKAAQAGREFVVIARVEALIAGFSPAEALRRGRAYAEAGADAVLMHSNETLPRNLFAVLRQWDRETPIVVVPTTYGHVTVTELVSRGVKMIIYANHGLRSAMRAMEETFAEILRTGSTVTVEPALAPLKAVLELQGTLSILRDDREADTVAGLPRRARRRISP